MKDKDDAAAIHEATEKLSAEMMKIYEVIQKAGAASAEQAAPNQEGNTSAEEGSEAK